MKHLFTIALISVSISTLVFAQESVERNIGLTANVQAEQIDFLIPIWTNETTAIAPSISVISAQDVGTDLSVGLLIKKYLREVEGAVPYLGVRGGAIFGIPDEGDSITDFFVGPAFGGEYFFKPKFSIGIEIQGNFTISDEGSFRFGNPGNVNFNTATALTASIYF